MKAFASLLSVAYVNAACECLGTEENGMPPSSLFTDKGYPADYGTKCSDWDKEDPTCQDGKANWGKDWCTEAWCYVAAENDCDPAAYDTVFFADTEYAGTLKFAVSACPKDAEAEESADGDASMALYASVMAVSVASIAASL